LSVVIVFREAGVIFETATYCTGLNVGGAELMLKHLVESHQDNPDYRHSVISLTLTGKVDIQLQEMSIEAMSLS